MKATWSRCLHLGTCGYCLTTAEMATVFSSFWPAILTVTLPAFSSTLTTVASVAEPLMVTFTLSPALICIEATGLVAGDAVAAGVAAAGVAALGLFSLLLLVFSVLDSHAVKASASKAMAKIFIVIVLPKYASERSIVQVSPVNVENSRNVSGLRKKKVCWDQRKGSSFK